MKFLQAEFASVRYHLAEIRDDWNDPRAHLREAHKSLDAIEVGLQRLPREFAERVKERLHGASYPEPGAGQIVNDANIDPIVEAVVAELEGEP